MSGSAVVRAPDGSEASEPRSGSSDEAGSTDEVGKASRAADDTMSGSAVMRAPESDEEAGNAGDVDVYDTGEAGNAGATVEGASECEGRER